MEERLKRDPELAALEEAAYREAVRDMVAKELRAAGYELDTDDPTGWRKVRGD